jgi:hypothetical protein
MWAAHTAEGAVYARGVTVAACVVQTLLLPVQSTQQQHTQKSAISVSQISCDELCSEC